MVGAQGWKGKGCRKAGAREAKAAPLAERAEVFKTVIQIVTDMKYLAEIYFFCRPVKAGTCICCGKHEHIIDQSVKAL